VVSARDPRLLEIIEHGLRGTLPSACWALARRCSSMRWRSCCARPATVAAAAPAGAAAASLAGGAGAGADAHEFVPYFQPKIAMQNGHLKGVEALARWQHPQRGLLSPAHFIDTLEGHPIMADFTLDWCSRCWSAYSTGKRTACRR
jgi:hypothetical protein